MNESFLKKMTILIVEDSLTERKVLVDMLNKYFSNIIEVSNGKEAYEVLKKKEKEIDIVISDIVMPELSGIELLKLVREFNLSIPFIFITGNLKSEDILKAIDLNVSSYLLKPVNPMQLLEKIDFLCEKKFYEKQLDKKKAEVENYKQAVDKASLIFRMDGDGLISYMNSAMRDISGYGKKDFGKINFDNIIHPDIPKKYIDETWKDIKDGKLWKGNTKFISKDGEIFYLNNTVFKVDNEKEEFITIAFLTTKENLEKRDFHKKVLIKFQESNKKEFELKKEIEKLKKETIQLIKYKELYADSFNVINSLKEKNIAKERQLVHYELQGDNLTQKYDKFMNAKKKEVDNLIKNLNIEKQKNELLSKKDEENSDLIETLKARCESYENEVKIKNNRLKQLIDIVGHQKNSK